ncbi:MAG: hypothetical protein R2942_16275 [Ignavibacteria bacterium]
MRSSTPAGGSEPSNTLEAIAGTARSPWSEPAALYQLFDEAYPQPKDGARRSAPLFRTLHIHLMILLNTCICRRRIAFAGKASI